MSRPRQYALVKFVCPDPAYEFYFKAQGIMDERALVYMGEIPNMLGHCVLQGHSGKTYLGYHIEDFVELTEDEV